MVPSEKKPQQTCPTLSCIFRSQWLCTPSGEDQQWCFRTHLGNNLKGYNGPIGNLQRLNICKKILHSRKTHYTHLVGECSGFRILRFDKSPFRFFLHFCTLNFVTGYLFPAMTMQNEVIPTATWHDWHLGQQHGTVQHGHIRLLTTCQRYT